jgi:hypothetical protein
MPTTAKSDAFATTRIEISAEESAVYGICLSLNILRM